MSNYPAPVTKGDATARGLRIAEHHGIEVSKAHLRFLFGLTSKDRWFKSGVRALALFPSAEAWSPKGPMAVIVDTEEGCFERHLVAALEQHKPAPRNRVRLLDGCISMPGEEG